MLRQDQYFMLFSRQAVLALGIHASASTKPSLAVALALGIHASTSTKPSLAVAKGAEAAKS